MSRESRKRAEEIRRKRKIKKRRRVLFLLAEVIILICLAGVGYVMKKYDKFQTNLFDANDIEVNDGMAKDGYTTVALFGGDSREGALEEGTHADTIIVAAINNKTKEIKMISLYRDTLMSQVDGKIKKANNAYFVGGPKDAINVLNKNFDLAIEDYVTVDFKALTDTIDLLGGIEVDVTEAEVEAANEYIWETAEVAKKEGKLLEHPGVQKLDGVQATTYARIRKNVGGDYKRTERQRLVLQKVAEKAKKTDISTLNNIINKVFPQISTSFTLREMISLASGALKYELGETSGFPFEVTDGRVDSLGSVVIPLGMVENVQELHAFLYPGEAYEVSETVKGISAEIENLTGYTRSDFHEEEQEPENDESQ